MTTPLTDLLDRVRNATGPDRELALDLMAMLGYLHDGFGKAATYDGRDASPIIDCTSSIDACIALIGEVLPGWCWKVGTCWVSDDVWLAPDWNSHVHGSRLSEELGEPVYGSVFDQGVDIDRRPPGNVPLALLEAILEALIAVRSISQQTKKQEVVG